MSTSLEVLSSMCAVLFWCFIRDAIGYWPNRSFVHVMKRVRSRALETTIGRQHYSLHWSESDSCESPSFRLQQLLPNRVHYDRIGRDLKPFSSVCYSRLASKTHSVHIFLKRTIVKKRRKTVPTWTGNWQPGGTGTYNNLLMMLSH